MLKRFLLIFGSFVLSSCSQDLIYSETAPSWVNDVRSGKGSLRFNNGDKILFRSNQKGNEQEKRENVCAAAIEKNVSYIKKAYPFSVQIPMTVELVFFDPKVNDCSTTISVSRQLMEKAESLSGLKGQYEKEMKRIKTETQKVQTDLKQANEEKQILENKIKKLNKIIDENKGYTKQIKTIEDFVESAKDERKQIKKKMESYIYAGMSFDEVARIMNGHYWQSGREYNTICTPWISAEMADFTRYKNYVVCGVNLEFKTGYVTKICNIETNSCFKKEMEY